MSKTYYDEFSRLNKGQMAQAMSDITFGYEETVVPKKHYEQSLSTTIEELMEQSVQANLLVAVFSMIKDLKEQNEKLFFQALLCLEEKVKPKTMSSQQYNALEESYRVLKNKKDKRILNPDIVAIYKENINPDGKK